MDFSWTSEQRELQRQTRDFCKRHLSFRDTRERDQACAFSRAAWDACAQQGIPGALASPDHGGAGLDALSTALLLETLGEHCDDRGLLFSIAAHLFACVEPVQRFGGAELQNRFLRPMAEGKLIATHAITESRSGSDVFAMSSRAVRQGDRYLLDGSKAFATNAPAADLFVVHVLTAPERGYFGVTAFILPRDLPGLRIGEPYRKVGLRTSPMSDVYFDECRVPESLRLGEEGQGASIFMHSMNWERAGLFALYVGSMQRQLDGVRAQARERKQFGHPIGHFQAVSHRIADMKVRLEASRLLLYRAVWALEHEGSDNAWSSISKLYISEAAVQSALDALQIHGAAGVMEGDVERCLRDTLPSRIFSGTSDIQRNAIAKWLRI